MSEDTKPSAQTCDQTAAPRRSERPPPPEIGGPPGPEPTRYGDWERNGRCSDF